MLGRTDVVVALLGGIAAVALLAAAHAFGSGIRVARDSAARVCIAAGVIAALAVGGRALVPPGPNDYVAIPLGSVGLPHGVRADGRRRPARADPRAGRACRGAARPPSRRRHPAVR